MIKNNLIALAIFSTTLLSLEGAMAISSIEATCCNQCLLKKNFSTHSAAAAARKACAKSCTIKEQECPMYTMQPLGG